MDADIQALDAVLEGSEAEGIVQESLDELRREELYNAMTFDTEAENLAWQKFLKLEDAGTEMEGAAGKPYHQMTLDEFISETGITEDAEEAHREEIQKALDAGLTVPENVMAEHPTLIGEERVVAEEEVAEVVPEEEEEIVPEEERQDVIEEIETIEDILKEEGEEEEAKKLDDLARAVREGGISPVEASGVLAETQFDNIRMQFTEKKKSFDEIKQALFDFTRARMPWDEKLAKDIDEVTTDLGLERVIERVAAVLPESALERLEAKVAPQPRDKRLRQTIMAWAKVKGLPKVQYLELFKRAGGSKRLTAMSGGQLEKVLAAVKKARPRTVRGKRVITQKTEKKIQSLREALMAEKALTDES
jgi:hypothetical protein